MKKLFVSRLLGLLLALTLLLTVCLGALPAFAELAASGTWGDNITWSVEDGVLTISGTGEMQEIESASQAPWRDQEFQSLVIRDGVTSLTKYLFGKTPLKTIEIAGSVKTIPDEAFSGFLLEKVVLHEGVTTIGSSAFRNCEKLAEISLPDSAVHIMERAFDDTGYYLNASNWTDNCALYIGHQLYKVNCFPNTEQPGRAPLVSGLTVPQGKFTVKSGTRSLAAIAFSSCDKIKEIVLPEGLTVVESRAFGSCTALEKLTIPSTLKYVGSYAFNDCKALKELAFPKGMEYIGAFAFQRVSLSRLLIPSGVQMEATTFASMDASTKVEEFYYGGSEQDLAKFNFRTYSGPAAEVVKNFVSPAVTTHYNYTASEFPAATPVVTPTPTAVPTPTSAVTSAVTPAVTPAQQAEVTDAPDDATALPADEPDKADEPDGRYANDTETVNGADAQTAGDTNETAELPNAQNGKEAQTTGTIEKNMSPLPFIIGGAVVLLAGAAAVFFIVKKRG